MDDADPRPATLLSPGMHVLTTDISGEEIRVWAIGNLGEFTLLGIYRRATDENTPLVARAGVPW